MLQRGGCSHALRMSGEQESEPENEANFYTSESQAQQSVPVHVCACTYAQIPEAAG